MNKHWRQIFGVLLVLVMMLAILPPMVCIVSAGTTGTYVADVDGDGEVTDADAIYVLMHTFFPDEYPISGNTDYDKDGEVTDADAIYLLMHTFFPDEYPIDLTGNPDNPDDPSSNPIVDGGENGDLTESDWGDL